MHRSRPPRWPSSFLKSACRELTREGYRCPPCWGSIWAQFVEGAYCYNQSFTFTVHPNNRDITAYSSLTRYNFVVTDPPKFTAIKYGEAGISRVVSGGHSEDFDPPLQRIKRNNVTEIRFIHELAWRLHPCSPRHQLLDHRVDGIQSHHACYGLREEGHEMCART